MRVSCLGMLKVEGVRLYPLGPGTRVAHVIECVCVCVRQVATELQLVYTPLTYN